MKLNRFMALAVISLLVVAAMGFVSMRSSAKAPAAHTQQVQTTSVTPAAPDAAGNPAAEAPDQEKASEDPDTDTIQEQVGDQVEDEQLDGAEDPGQEDAGPDEQAPSYSGSISVDQATTEGMSESSESAALAGQAKITIEEAKTAALDANPGTTIVKAELDNENGVLVYSVELNNGTEVKVDAGNGVILHTEVGGDHED